MDEKEHNLKNGWVETVNYLGTIVASPVKDGLQTFEADICAMVIKLDEKWQTINKTTNSYYFDLISRQI